MPKSKHRKNAKGKKLVHKKKFTYSTIWLPEEQINAIKNLFLHAEMVAISHALVANGNDTTVFEGSTLYGSRSISVIVGMLQLSHVSCVPPRSLRLE